MIKIKTVIIEDKTEELEHLKKLLSELADVEFTIMKELSSIKEGVAFLKEAHGIDLLFMDIQLTDGESFEILKQVKLEAPIIFVSSYDHYALKAIKSNGVDYLLKPIALEDLSKAVDNFLKMRPEPVKVDLETIEMLVRSFAPKSFKSSFLVNYKHKMVLVNVDEVACFHVKEKAAFLVTLSGQEYLVDYALEQLEEQLDPNKFFRINRQYLVSRSAIKEIENYFNGRLIITCDKLDEKVILSKKRVAAFKNWADS